MLDFLFSYGGYAPHGYCIAWDPLVLWSHIGADAVIALSYFGIPVLILLFLRNRTDLSIRAPASMFALFITFCGLSHVVAIVTFFTPAYGLQAVVKLATAAISAATAALVISMMPRILRLPSPQQLLSALAAHEDELRQRQAAEAELRRTLTALRTANSELRELSYAAAHDLKSPSVAVLYWLETFAEEHGEALDDATRTEFEVIANHVRRMSQQTSDIYEFTQLLSATFDQAHPVDLEKVLDTVLEGLQPQIEDAGAQIDRGALPVVTGHPQPLTLMLENLLGNAIKFRDPERPLQIRVDAAPDPEAPERSVLRVTDNGIGVDAAERERIFSLFYRLNLAEEYEGSGMGLALCRRVAALHGGRIWAEPLRRGGTRLCVALPLAEPRALLQAA